MNMPILLNHDQDFAIGFIEAVDDKLFFNFTSDLKIKREMAFDIFGGAGIEVIDYIEENEIMIIKRGSIVEFTLTE